MNRKTIANLSAEGVDQSRSDRRLPVQQSTNVELIVNLQTARMLGLEVPISILMRVNDVIE
jgi:putative ABC transport system substrate-binding protein